MKIVEAINNIAALRDVHVDVAEFMFEERVAIKLDGSVSPSDVREAYRQAYEETMKGG